MNKLLVLCFALLISGVAYAAETTISQSHTTFDTDEATIKVGDTLIFTNKDDVTHNIQIVNSDGDVEDKGLQKPGEKIKVVFPVAGDYKSRCAIHPKMKLAITVK